MNHRSRLRTAVVWLGVVLAILVAPAARQGPTGAGTAAPTLAAQGPRLVLAGGQEGACSSVGLVPAGTIDGATLCTTGPEPGDPALTPAAGDALTEATAGIQCYGNGANGARVQFVYAHPASVNRLASFLPMMRTRAAQMDAIFNTSAAQTGGQRHIRFHTDANCNVDVLSVTVDPAVLPAANFAGLMNTMVTRGYTEPDRKYVIWTETNGADPSTCSGLGTLYFDTNPTAANWNNDRVGYARLDETCLRDVFDGRTEAHELMHTIGGVQGTAPNATPGGHCRDEGDRMCYDDDGSGPVAMRSVCSATNELRFDCGHDDYFYAGAPCGAGGFLANHWNTADSRWLEARPANGVAVPANDSPGDANRLAGYSGSVKATNAGATVDPNEVAPAGKVGGHSIWFSWTAPVSGRTSFDTCGSDTDTLLGVYTGSPTSAPASLAAVDQSDDDALLGDQGRVTFTATAGTTYLVAVDGKDGDQGGVNLRWGAPFHGYRDVKLGAWYEASVNWVKRFGLIDPATPTTFAPRAEMTRSQVVDTLWRLVDRPAARSATTFSDVPANAPYRAALNWAVEAGVTAGYADGTFHPANTVKRGQFVTMLWNLAGHPTGAPAAGFPDVPPGAKLSQALDWARAEGLVTAYPDGTFRPKKTLTRQQVTAILFDLAGNSDAWSSYAATLPSTVVFRH